MTAKEFNRCLDALPNDRNALEKIYNEYYLQLVYTALSMTKNREAAYDIASTVMLKLAGYRRTEWINSPAGFLIRMVHNVTKDYFRIYWFIGKRSAKLADLLFFLILFPSFFRHIADFLTGEKR